ncbi:unnamed protein product [Durusdinium trenchii]|uniref:Uncharacterized protein n=1 Tax=Durusdinium trenchii TaxID=1381693 RepID=A0ABP0I3J8_9DINO
MEPGGAPAPPPGGWKPLVAKKAPWEHRPARQVALEERSAEEERQQENGSWDRIMQLYQDSKGSNFDEDKDVIVYDVDFDLQVPSVQLKELASLEELRAELQRTPMATPPFAKACGFARRPQICMLGPHTYKKQEQQVSVFPVLDPSQERVVPLAKCAIYRKGSLA